MGCTTRRSRRIVDRHRDGLSQTGLRSTCRSGSLSRCRGRRRACGRGAALRGGRRILRGGGARRVHVHCAADEQTNYACSYQGDGTLGALCRVSIDRAVGSAAGGVFVYLVKFVAGVAHLSSFHGSLFTGWYRTVLPGAWADASRGYGRYGLGVLVPRVPSQLARTNVNAPQPAVKETGTAQCSISS